MRLSPIAIGIAVGLVVALALAPFAGGGLERLAQLRARYAAATALVAAPPALRPAVGRDASFAAGSAAAARAQIAARIRDRARAGGVLVEQIAPRAAPAWLAAVEVRLSGGEKAVLALADTLERERPLIRFAPWRIEALPDGAVRLTAEAIAPWQ